MTDIFSPAVQAETSLEPAVQAEQNAIIPSYQLIGEGKRYKTMEEADKALIHHLEHIKKLEEEARKRDEELIKARTLDEVLNKISDKTQDGTTQTSNVATTDSALTPEKVQETVDKRYAEIKAKELMEANRKAVEDQLLKTYGTPAKAREVLEKTAKELDTSVETLRSLAMSNPRLALKTLIPSGVNPPTNGFIPSASPVNNTPHETYNAYNDDLKLKLKTMKGPEADKYLKERYAHMNLKDGD